MGQLYSLFAKHFKLTMFKNVFCDFVEKVIDYLVYGRHSAARDAGLVRARKIPPQNIRR